jgi:TusA-related sulfurtransferase
VTQGKTQNFRRFVQWKFPRIKETKDMPIIDLRGISCPTNFVKAKLALEMADPGEIVELLLDDGEPVKNVPRSLKAEGHKLLALKEEEGHYRLTLEKGEE